MFCSYFIAILAEGLYPAFSFLEGTSVKREGI